MLETIEYTFAWLQNATWGVFALLMLVMLSIGYVMRIAEARGALNRDSSQSLIGGISTVVGLVLGPAILFLMITIVYPPFGRYIINEFIPWTRTFQIEFQTWLNANLTDDLSAIGLGGALGNLQLGLGILFPVLGLMFKGVLKALMNVGHRHVPVPRWVVRRA